MKVCQKRRQAEPANAGWRKEPSFAGQAQKGTYPGLGGQIERHTKVKGDKSPFDGDWSHWTARLGKDPTKPKRVCVLMKLQKGRCTVCGLRLRATDVLEVHHRDGNHHNHHYLNLALIHGHCHDFAHRSQVLMTTAA